jgi:4-hydroxy-tetrahydrodipicolinate reductase
MKIGLIGFGKMGGATQIAAIERGHEVGAIISSKGDDFSSLKDVDICIDFTAPDAVLENLRKIAPLKKILSLEQRDGMLTMMKFVKWLKKLHLGFFMLLTFPLGSISLESLFFMPKS